MSHIPSFASFESLASIQSLLSFLLSNTTDSHNTLQHCPTLLRLDVRLFFKIFVFFFFFNPERSYLENHRLAIVCSARSGSTKALGTTNLLLQAAKEALSSELDSPGPSLSNSVASLTQSSSNNNVDSTATPTRPGSAFHRGTSRSGRATPARSESRNNVKRSSSSSDGPLSLIGKLDALKMAQANPGSPSINGDSSSSNNHEEKSNPPVGFNATVDRIIFDHLEALKGAVQSEEIRQQVSDDIVDDCERLRDFLMAAKVSLSTFHPSHFSLSFLCVIQRETSAIFLLLSSFVLSRIANRVLSSGSFLTLILI